MESNGRFYDNQFFGSERRSLLSHVDENNTGYDSTQKSLLSHVDENNTGYDSTQKPEEEHTEPWKLRLSDFTAKKQGDVSVKRLKSKKVRRFYRAQDELIEAYEDVSRLVSDNTDVDFSEESKAKRAMRYSRITFGLNLLLMAAKLAASILSGSLSIISSLIDSVVDLLSGAIMWWASHAIQTRNTYKYPQGRTKLEPVSIIILSVVMALASLVFIQEAVTKIVDLTSDPDALPIVEIPVFVIAGSTVVIKFILWLACRRVDSQTVQALALDHRNDVLSNLVAIVCGYLGSKEFQDKFDLYGFIYVDPGGAILISLYIIFNWCLLGAETIRFLTGHTAEPQVLSKIMWVVMTHDENIHQIDTVRAFHFGFNLLVDVDIVLPATMSVGEAHDIAETLQAKLERLPEVERAYVHVDYEASHCPGIEHKLV